MTGGIDNRLDVAEAKYQHAARLLEEMTKLCQELASAGYRLQQLAGGADVEGVGNLQYACPECMFSEQIAAQRIKALVRRSKVAPHFQFMDVPDTDYKAILIGLLKLYVLGLEGKNSSPEANVISNESDEPWFNLSATQQMTINCLSIYLSAIEHVK